ncbi:Hsp20/alpha crystallin family protein [uncultured Georgenia sp.]|uniref:Hsp20/alpha crystallin family protein n=1 Tax=uncultured Georgenia sp. TaxID=378209 RepID=UPI002631AC80|nr:Hsp20/alpha crystallin family protein [uncultured Georgenia sp.]
MNEIFGNAFAPLRMQTQGIWRPAVDIEETDTAYVLEADLPGVKRDDVTVELTNNVLSIHGELKERERVGVLRHKTRRTGEFDYRMTLPADIDPEKVTATLNDGVLRVEVAKAEAAQPKRIEIAKG